MNKGFVGSKAGLLVFFLVKTTLNIAVASNMFSSDAKLAFMIRKFLTAERFCRKYDPYAVKGKIVA